MQEPFDSGRWLPPKAAGFGLPDDAMDGTRPPKTTRTNPWLVAAAWFTIAAVIATILISQAVLNASLDDDPNPDDPIGLLLSRMQMQYIVGASKLAPGNARLNADLYDAALQFNLGTVAQRQRFLPVAAEIAGREEARDHLFQLQHDVFEMEERQSDPAFELTEAQHNVNTALDVLYGDDTVDGPEAVAELTDDQRALLVQELEWFGELALHPEGVDDSAARQAVLAPATRVMATLVTVAILSVVLGLVGFIGLIVMIVLLTRGKFSSSIDPGRVAHGIYAETFAIWLVGFFLLQEGIAVVFEKQLLPDSWQMPMVLIGFFASLVALGWPVVRGATFSDVRKDIGLTLGHSPGLEPLLGPMCYIVGLPIVGLGLVMTLVLMLLQGALAMGGAGTELIFTPTGGAAHPVILEVAGGNWSARIQVLLLAAVAAPIVEETMFRGVLYRHLRDGYRRQGFVISVILSTALSSFVFAIIHPQGWVAVPLLMSLAVVFCLAREWRGTLIPSILVHGISNGLVLTLLIVVLSG
jgi:membrane protease YdiL (CAAX protease family)